MARDPLRQARGVLLAVLPAVCYLAGRLLLKRLALLLPDGCSASLLELLCALLLLPVAVVFWRRSPEQTRFFPGSSEAAQRLTVWVLGLLCLGGLAFVCLRRTEGFVEFSTGQLGMDDGF